MWTLRRPVACVAVALAVVDLAWTAPSVFAHQIWNANFGLVFLLASIVLAWAVAVGSFGWWPVLVFTASVTVQAQLFYALMVVQPRDRPFWSMAFRVAETLALVDDRRRCGDRLLASDPHTGGLRILSGISTGLLAARTRRTDGLAFGLRNMGESHGRVLFRSVSTTSPHLTSSLEPARCGRCRWSSSWSRSSRASPRDTGERTWRRCDDRTDLLGVCRGRLRIRTAWSRGPSSWLVPMLWIVAYLLVADRGLGRDRGRARPGANEVSLRGRPSPSRVVGVPIGVLVVMGLVGSLEASIPVIGEPRELRGRALK